MQLNSTQSPKSLFCSDGDPWRNPSEIAVVSNQYRIPILGISCYYWIGGVGR